jgi:hypothetical protein
MGRSLHRHLRGRCLGAAFPDSYVDRFRAAALRTWNLVHTGKDDGVHLGAPNAWDNRNNVSKFDPPKTPDPGYFDFATPRFAGGTWQYDLFADQRTNEQCGIFVEDWKGPAECNCLTAPSDPSIPDPNHPSLPKVFLGPYQMTVMNGLYLVLALRLAGTNHHSIAAAALKAAEAQFGFFRAWFGRDPRQPLNEAPSLLLTQRDRTALVRERVAWYANDDQVGYWDPETCWGGDQGLVLGGLVDYLSGVSPGRRHEQGGSPTDRVRGQELDEAERILHDRSVVSTRAIRALAWLPGR